MESGKKERKGDRKKERGTNTEVLTQLMYASYNSKHTRSTSTCTCICHIVM